MEALLPEPWPVALDRVLVGPGSSDLVVTSIQPHVTCPDCGQRAQRVPSRYHRTVADLPWLGLPVRLRLRSRRFFCDVTSCRRTVFTERFPMLVAKYARCTTRLGNTLRLLGNALGGEAGARLAARLGMTASPDRLLQQLRQCAPNQTVAPRVLGVDDWAFRKGHHYGTILVDLERHCPVDLLPDRRGETLATWLREHPGVEVVARDRSGTYAEAARQGAPEALQVADRWHLLKNLAEALEAVLLREHRALHDAAHEAAAQAPPAPPPLAAAPPVAAPEGSAAETPVQDTWTQRAARDKAARRERRYARYREVAERHERGESGRQIAAALGLARATVSRYLQAGSFPESARRATAAAIQPFVPYLRRRWDEGGHNGGVLWAEIAAQGFPGPKSSVYRCTAPWRQGLPPEERRSPRLPPRAAAPSGRAPSPRAVVWWLIGRKEKPTAEQRALVEGLCERRPEIARARKLVQEFFRLVRERQRERLEPWREAVAQSGIRELIHFSAGLRRDWEAVVAALTLRWSNGPVEGEINRLKLIKRQMYGRAGFPLLRARVLAA